MKILHVGQKIKGGTASHLCDVLPFQIATLGTDKVALLIPEDQIEFVPDVPRAALRTFASSRRGVRALLDMAAAVRRVIVAERPDVVHLHSSFAGAVARLAYLTLRRRPPTLYCAHGWSFNMRTSIRRRALYAAMERRLAPLVDVIACISQYELQTAAERGLPRAKLRLVYNGIAPDARPTGAPAFEPRADAVTLLFVGRLHEQKGYDTLVAAMRRLLDRPIMLHTVGPETPDGTALPANVIEHGWQPRGRIADFIAAADAIVVPSRWEGFGLVAIEAMRQGRAVCASNVDALPELVVDGATGYLFPPDDVAALATLLGSLDKPTLAQLGHSGRQRFLADFTADKMNRALIDLYAGLAAR